MTAIIRSPLKPIGSVLLPGGELTPRRSGGAREVPVDALREIIRDAHEESAMASAADAVSAMDFGARSGSDPSHALSADREAARREGFAQGHQEGLASGLETSSQEWQSKLEDMDLLVEAFQKEREELMPKLEDDLVTIVFEAITSIIGDAANNKRVVLEAVRKAAAGVAADSPITIRVCPSQFDQLSNCEEMSFIGRRKGTVEWVEDARVELGGCIVETGRGTLDARLETQVDRLRRALLTARTQS